MYKKIIMRTNIEIDDSKIKTIIELTGLKTKREIIDSALDDYVKRLLRMELLKTKGMGWEGDLNEMRLSKYI